VVSRQAESAGWVRLVGHVPNTFLRIMTGAVHSISKRPASHAPLIVRWWRPAMSSFENKRCSGDYLRDALRGSLSSRSKIAPRLWSSPHRSSASECSWCHFNSIFRRSEPTRRADAAHRSPLAVLA
jgi:hypothetical protein